MKITDFSLRHPAIITILCVALIFFAALSLGTLKLAFFPNVSPPMVVVMTIYPGAGGRDIEAEITRHLEEELSSLRELREMESTSQDSLSSIKLKFNDNVDVYELLPEIREKINKIRSLLPDDLPGDPIITPMGSVGNLPIYSLRLQGKRRLQELSRIAKNEIQPEISRIEGVSRIVLRGSSFNQLEIAINIDALNSRKIPILQVVQILNSYNKNLPAGLVDYQNKELYLSTSGTFQSIDQIGNIVIDSRDNTPIFLKDIATISIKGERPDILISDGEKEALIIDVFRREDGDTIQIISAIEQKISRIKKEYDDLSFTVILDYSKQISASMKGVLSSALLGFFLAVLVILLFLHEWRATLIIGISIPLSILITLICMKLSGQNLNFLSLSGITISLGMIVDGAIVVLENIHMNQRKYRDPLKAASVGSSEVGGAILASATTSIGAFLPLEFLSGIVGYLLKDIALTIVFSLAASAIVSIIIIPLLSAKFLKKRARNKKQPKIIRYLKFYSSMTLYKLEMTYKNILNFIFKHKIKTLAFSIILLVFSIINIFFIGYSFLPSTDTNEFEMEIRFPSGYQRKDIQEKVKQISTILKTEIPELKTATFYIGTGDLTAYKPASNFVSAKCALVSKTERDRSVYEIIDLVQKKISSSVTDLKLNVVNAGLDNLMALASGGRGYRLEVYGPNIDSVVKAALLLEKQMLKDPEIIKTDFSVSLEKEDIITSLDFDSIGSTGLTPQQIALTARVLFHGLKTGVYRENNQDYEIFLSTNLKQRKINTRDFSYIGFISPRKKFIPFTSIARIQKKVGISEINKRNKNFSIEVIGYLKSENQAGVEARLGDQL